MGHVRARRLDGEALRLRVLESGQDHLFSHALVAIRRRNEGVEEVQAAVTLGIPQKRLPIGELDGKLLLGFVVRDVGGGHVASA